MINWFDSLNISLTEGEFCKKYNFCSALKNTIIAQLKHFIHNENEKFRRLQYFVKFSRYTIICEMFDSKAIFLNEKFKCDPRKCNFASSFSGCVQRNKSKMITALPTKAETVPLFEKKN